LFIIIYSLEHFTEFLFFNINTIFWLVFTLFINQITPALDKGTPTRDQIRTQR